MDGDWSTWLDYDFPIQLGISIMPTDFHSIIYYQMVVGIPPVPDKDQ